MAFFKFRLPGQAPATATATEGLAAAPGESMEVLRRRARHRLFGAVVLVFVAVVAFPLLFDSQPRTVAVDTPIVIPDRNGTPPLAAETVMPPTQLPAKPLLPKAPEAPVPAQASLEPGKEEVVAPGQSKPNAQHAPAQTVAEAPAQPVAPPAPVAKTEAKPEPKLEPKPVSKAEPKPVSKPEPKAKPESKDTAKSASDAQRAKALLDGKGASAESTRVVVQVGAFADADKAREVRRKLEQAGLKTYTQSIEGKDGKHTTRVRVGPFETRAEADKALARIRKLDLQASVIAL